MITRMSNAAGENVVFFTDDTDALWALERTSTDEWVVHRQWAYIGREDGEPVVNGTRTPGTDERSYRPWRWVTAHEAPTSWVFEGCSRTK